MAFEFFFERHRREPGKESTHVYSPSFASLIRRSQDLKRLLEGSEIFMRPFEPGPALYLWEQGRKPIAEIIDFLFEKRETPLRVLDYGSANGFLLRSLQEWSKHDIEPYGYDTHAKGIQDAKKLFPDKKTHFASAPKDLAEFPSQFDVVYWNLWDNWDFSAPDAGYRLNRFKELLRRAGPEGYLILGLYDPKHKDQDRKLEALKRRGFTPLGVRRIEGQNETFVWFKGTP